MLAKHGSGLCGDIRRCESMIRDVCGDRTKEAHLLIQSLKQQVPADMIAMSPGTATAPLPTLQHFQQRLEDSIGMAESAAHWAVTCWAFALGIAAEDDFQLDIPHEKPSTLTADVKNPTGDKKAERMEVLKKFMAAWKQARADIADREKATQAASVSNPPEPTTATVG